MILQNGLVRLPMNGSHRQVLTSGIPDTLREAMVTVTIDKITEGKTARLSSGPLAIAIGTERSGTVIGKADFEVSVDEGDTCIGRYEIGIA